MNIENVKALADILNQSGLSSLEVNEGETKIKLVKAAAPSLPVPAFSVPIAEQPAQAPGNAALDFNKILEVKSPIVGVFYSAPAPDSEPFVNIGSKVKKGDVLCIIEAMKLMNEITAECDGEIVDICAKNGEIAEFGQVLFKLY
jgi:acetyl-CoA carboxylase biotin carboxyl carrier protein